MQSQIKHVGPGYLLTHRCKGEYINGQITTWRKRTWELFNQMQVQMSNGYCTHAFDQVLKVIERVYTQIAAHIRCGRPDWSEQDWREFCFNCTAKIPPTSKHYKWKDHRHHAGGCKMKRKLQKHHLNIPYLSWLSHLYCQWAQLKQTTTNRRIYSDKYYWDTDEKKNEQIRNCTNYIITSTGMQRNA